MKLYMAALLATLFLSIFNEGIVRGCFGNQLSPRNSCLDLHTEEIDIRTIVKYEEQAIPFKAVIFINKNGTRICVEPDLTWVQKHIKHLNHPKPSRKIRPSKKIKSTSRRRARSTPESMDRSS